MRLSMQEMVAICGVDARRGAKALAPGPPQKNHPRRQFVPMMGRGTSFPQIKKVIKRKFFHLPVIQTIVEIIIYH